MKDLRRNLFSKPERRDESVVGITFVDVLFALVVGQILLPVAEGLHIPWAGKTQLLLAFVLTVTSWVGYHNSWNRPRFFIRFLNLPLAQFVIDVLLVIAYWLTATWVEGLPLENRTASALPESVLISVCFLLYVAWDQVGLKMRASDRYFGRPLSRDVPQRRRVSGFFFFLAVFTTAIVIASSPITSAPVIAIDIWLVIVLLGYRIAKEAVTPPEARETESDKEPNAIN